MSAGVWVAGGGGASILALVTHSHTHFSIHPSIQAAASFRKQHSDVFAAAAAAAAALPIGQCALRPRGGDVVEGVRDWWFKFQVLFNRTLQTYTRDPTNLSARVVGSLFYGIIQGTLFADLGRLRGLLGFPIMSSK